MTINYLKHVKTFIDGFIEHAELNPEEMVPVYFAARKEEYGKLQEFYGAALKLNPYDASAYYNLGQIFHKKGDYRQALKNFSSSIEMEPNFSFAYIARGETYAALGEYDNSIADFNKAAELNFANVVDQLPPPSALMVW